jgi:hypothetical protein
MSYRRPRVTLLHGAEEIQVKIGSGINSVLPIRSAGRVPSIYSGPHIDLALPRAEEGSVFCVWFLFARISRTGPRRKIDASKLN